MITRFLTEVRVAFNPFSPRSKPARLFLSLIPADARANGMLVQSTMLPRTSTQNATLGVKFSTCHLDAVDTRVLFDTSRLSQMPPPVLIIC